MSALWAMGYFDQAGPPLDPAVTWWIILAFHAVAAGWLVGRGVAHLALRRGTQTDPRISG